MKYNYKGEQISRLTVGSQELTLVPGQDVEIKESNDVVRDMLQVGTLTETAPPIKQTIKIDN